VRQVPPVVIPAGPHAPSTARAWLEELRPLMSNERMDDLRIAVSELVTNSVRHAGLRAGDPVRLSGRVSELSVVVTVADGGPGFNFDPDGPPHAPDGGGRGLLVVTALSERLLIDGGGRVTVEILRR
jgi:anti-sigma regulatory factor (Ser/Thr protein kinase)